MLRRIDKKKMAKEVKISINPPPSNKRCEGCGRHISELKPFGKEGDPLMGNFEGAMLIKTFRPLGVAQKEDKAKIDRIRRIFDLEAKKEKSPEEVGEMLKKEFGEDLERLMFGSQLIDSVGASWECRDCIILSDEDYFNKKSGKNGKRK